MLSGEECRLCRMYGVMDVSVFLDGRSRLSECVSFIPVSGSVPSIKSGSLVLGWRYTASWHVIGRWRELLGFWLSGNSLAL